MSAVALALAGFVAVSGQDEMALGLRAERAGDLVGARAHLQGAVQVAPNLGIGHVELLDVLVRLEEKGPELYRTLADAERLEPNNPRVWRLAGQAAELRADPAQAEAAYEKSIGLRGDDGPTRMRLGNLYRAQAKNDAALAQFKAATELDPHDHLARLALADALVTTGDLPEAEHQLRQLVTEAPKSPVFRQRLEEVQVRRGERTQSSPSQKRKLRALAPSRQ